MMNVQSSSASLFGPRDVDALPESATISLNELNIPDSLFIRGITVDFIGRPAAGGRFSDVFRGTYQGREVAVKRLCVRSPRDETTTLYQRFCEEALTWKDLKHERILDFIGIDQEAFKSNGSLCMVSPWMAKGTLTEYLHHEGAAPINHKAIMMDIASGLRFLHSQSPPLAHGDLHGSNVLLDIDCRASLGDFGLTAVADQFSARREWAGAIRWLSPELLHIEGDPPPKTTSGDVFAFGRVCWSVFTRHVPFPEVLNPWALIPKIMKNIQPGRPTQNDCFGTVLSDEMWALISRCWDSNAVARPHMDEICRILEGTTIDYLPPSLFISEISMRENNAPVANGTFAEVFRGTYQGQDVAIKRFRIYLSDASEDKKLYKRFYREARTWAQLRHPRILAFLGIDEDALRDQGLLHIISPWMARGTLMEYLDQAGDEPVDHDLLLTDVLSGLNHLHSRSLAHGDLHGSNVYINDQGHAMLGDFGLTTVADLKSVTTTINQAGAIRWMSPELLFNNASKTMAGDIFSFGRICLAVYTRRAPFHEIRQDLALVMNITHNEHPSKPAQDHCFGVSFPDDLWQLVLRCWDPDPAARPTSLEVIREHNRISQLHLPPALLLDGVSLSQDAGPVAFGDFANVFRGTHEGQDVAIKRHNLLSSENDRNDRFSKRFYREILIWRQLRHPRILPLLGIDRDALIANGSLDSVSPWMMNGTLAEYIFDMTNSNIQHKLLITDVALGLQYLHRERYAHGNLTASNVLIDSNGRLLLSGFMFTAPTETIHLLASTTINKAGALRWMAPELLCQESEGPPPLKTTNGDIFALGRLCLFVSAWSASMIRDDQQSWQVYTRRHPYHSIANDMGVVMKVIRHEHPARPTEDECYGTAMPDSLWEMIVHCWDSDPEARPTIENIILKLDEIAF